MVTCERILADHLLATTARYLARLAAMGGGYTLRGVSSTTWKWPHECGSAASFRVCIQ